MNKIEKLIERAKYYERLTRQYCELSDFLQALKFNDEEPVSYYGIQSNSFVRCHELKITTPAVIEGSSSSTKLIYSVNLISDLDMKDTNLKVTQILIQDIEDRMRRIEDELLQVFDGLDEAEGLEWQKTQDE